MINRVMLIGRIASDLELKTFGTAAKPLYICDFTLAVSRPMKNAQGEFVCDFIKCVCFGSTAINLTKYKAKGGMLGVEGSIQVDSYLAKDNTTRYQTKVVCNTLEFITKDKEKLPCNSK